MTLRHCHCEIQQALLYLHGLIASLKKEQSLVKQVVVDHSHEEIICLGKEKGFK